MIGTRPRQAGAGGPPTPILEPRCGAGRADLRPALTVHRSRPWAESDPLDGHPCHAPFGPIHIFRSGQQLEPDGQIEGRCPGQIHEPESGGEMPGTHGLPAGLQSQAGEELAHGELRQPGEEKRDRHILPYGNGDDDGAEHRDEGDATPFPLAPTAPTSSTSGCWPPVCRCARGRHWWPNWSG